MRFNINIPSVQFSPWNPARHIHLYPKPEPSWAVPIMLSVPSPIPKLIVGSCSLNTIHVPPLSQGDPEHAVGAAVKWRDIITALCTIYSRQIIPYG